MRIKTPLTLALAAFFIFGAFLKEADAASVRMRVVILNPSATLTQTKSVRGALPREIAAKDVLDDGGMDIDYDNKEGVFIVSKKDIVLEPGETKVFEVLLDDVWLINEDKIDTMRKRTEKIVHAMRESKAYERVALIAEGMYARMDQIIRNQNNNAATTNQHISYYRDHLKMMEQLEKDIAELERILVTAGGAVSIDAIENADLNVKGPDIKTTWIIIFVILIFLGILGAVFYFTWQGQPSLKEKDKDAAVSPPAFKENNSS